MDTCASGGRRDDLETLRRAVPLWRSDFAYQPTPMQMQTFGLLFWIPYFGTAINSADPYVFRSQMTPAVGLGLDPGKIEADQVALRRLLGQWRELARYYFGDFFPLTEYKAGNSAWIAWQLNDASSGGGAIQAFRREDSPFTLARFKLRGLDAAARYAVRNPDSPEVLNFTGKQLSEEGLPVSITNAPGAVTVLYAKSK